MKPRCAYEMFALIRLPDQSIINAYQTKTAADQLAKLFQESAPPGTTYTVRPAYVMVPSLERGREMPVRTLADDKYVVLPPMQRRKESVIVGVTKPAEPEKPPPPAPRKGGPGRPNNKGKLILELRKTYPLMQQNEIADQVGCSCNYVHLILKKAGMNARA